MADDADLLDELAAGLDPTDATLVAEAPLPLARRALREWLRGDHPPDSATVERVLSVAAGEARATDIGSRAERAPLAGPAAHRAGRPATAAAEPMQAGRLVRIAAARGLVSAPVGDPMGEQEIGRDLDASYRGRPSR